VEIRVEAVRCGSSGSSRGSRPSSSRRQSPRFLEEPPAIARLPTPLTAVGEQALRQDNDDGATSVKDAEESAPGVPTSEEIPADRVSSEAQGNPEDQTTSTSDASAAETVELQQEVQPEEPAKAETEAEVSDQHNEEQVPEQQPKPDVQSPEAERPAEAETINGPEAERCNSGRGSRPASSKSHEFGTVKVVVSTETDDKEVVEIKAEQQESQATEEQPTATTESANSTWKS